MAEDIFNCGKIRKKDTEEKFLTPFLLNMNVGCEVLHFTGVSGLVLLQNLHVVQSLEGLVIIWSNT